MLLRGARRLLLLVVLRVLLELMVELMCGVMAIIFVFYAHALLLLLLPVLCLDDRAAWSVGLAGVWAGGVSVVRLFAWRHWGRKAASSSVLVGLEDLLVLRTSVLEPDLYLSLS